MSCSAKDKFNVKHILLVMACVLVSMLFCCAYTSPLYPHYINSDSPIFMLIGRGIAEGKTCYVDLFDHKGPVMFFIEALGWAIAGRTGIWLLECAAMLVCIAAIGGICKELKANSFLPIIASAAVLFSTFCHGNLTEDYSLPLIYISLYFAIKYLASGKEKHPPLYALVYGISFGLLAFIRINNALIVCALILCIAIELICKKEYACLFKNLAAGLAGVVLVAIPICAYFYAKGALYDMVYATFLYNLLYAEESSHGAIFSRQFLHFAVLYAPIVYATVVFVVKRKALPKVLSITMITASALSLLMLLYANIYEHYFTLAIPMFTVAVAVTYPHFEISDTVKIRRALQAKKISGVLLVVIVVYLGLSAYMAAAPFYKGYITDISYDRYNQISTGAQVIPEDERDSVLGFAIPVEWYFDADLVPCYKYYTLQYWWTTSQLDVYGETLDYMRTQHPAWLITRNDMNDPEVKIILSDDYELVTQNDYACYYRYCGGET